MLRLCKHGDTWRATNIESEAADFENIRCSIALGIPVMVVEDMQDKRLGLLPAGARVEFLEERAS